MTCIVVLDKAEHRTLRVRAGPWALGGDNVRFVQVTTHEFPSLVPHYPLFFSKDAETGAFYCGAMMGFDEGENLFLEDEQDTYRPLELQRLPFYAAGPHIALDLDSARVGDPRGELLFDEDGQESAYLARIAAAFRALKPGLETTRGYIARLLALNVVAPIEIKISFDDGFLRDLRGLYTIDKSALRMLPDADVLDLFRQGDLDLISLMLASLERVPVLAQRKNRRLAEMAVPA
jgi:hypothetical protein